MERSSAVYDIDWFNDLSSFGRLNLDPPYQRHSVWSRRYKQFFIDTILNNFPSPAIFIHKRKTDTDYMYDVVDGKQRLTAIFEFQANEFSLARDHDQFPGSYFEDLPREYQLLFGNYKVPVEILTAFDVQDLRQVFDRLNRNVRKLNAQELRHARYDGSFLTLMENLTSAPFWKDIGVRTESRIRSMRDVEYISEIFLLTIHGVMDSDARTLDTYYAKYDDEENYEEVEEARELYEQCLTIMKQLGVDFLRASRFSNLNDFYSLWAAIKDYAAEEDRIDYQVTANHLKQFDRWLADLENFDDTESIAEIISARDALQYSDAVRQGANKATNRKLRADILKKLVEIK